MWLINTSTLSLEPFYGDKIPPYAILSHTWDDSEVSMHEFIQVAKNKNDKTTRTTGYRKITAACDQAQRDGHRYLWIDTCCIDKASSAELTEAINSMFTWYKQSQVCYAYLSDLKLDVADVFSKRDQFVAEFRQCRWFTRGWCLQELLAPRHIKFFNHKWQEIGRKSSLGSLISDITGVPRILLHFPPKKHISDFPIAARISWISKRQTTRVEDMSYSLLGIFGINMPMLYGEGEKAFLRLQQEIIQKYNDLSIFAWTGFATASGFSTILANRPSAFAVNTTVHHVRDVGNQLVDRLSTQFSFTNQGIFFPNAKLRYETAATGYRHQYLFYLNYRELASRNERRRKYILLQKVGPGIFTRLHETPDRLKAFEKQPRSAAFYEPVCILNDLSWIDQQLVLWDRHAVRL